jgi:DtxR family Mn-dependent transcriptional regulator
VEQQHSVTEENYIKAIFHLSQETDEAVSTNAIAEMVGASAASVTDMMKRLREKRIIEYERYRGVRLTSSGDAIARQLVRRHRLWEVFLKEKLGFSWDEVHEIAEQLEHIKSDLLIDRLDSLLAYPRFDPHGDPIPDSQGKMGQLSPVRLSSLRPGDQSSVQAVADTSVIFLQYLDQLKIGIGSSLIVCEIHEYDKSILIETSDGRRLTISSKAADNLVVREPSADK